MRISLTPIKRLYRLLRGIFYPFADVAVLVSENTSDKKSIVHTLSLKEGFFWGIYKKKGLGRLGA